MTIDSMIRKIARSTYWQNLYLSAKEINNINLFDNVSNFSGLQLLFLYWVQLYSVLYDEINQKKWKYLDQKVIDNDIRCDAFLYWRKNQIDSEIEQNKNQRNVDKLKFKSKGKASLFNVDFQGGK